MVTMQLNQDVSPTTYLFVWMFGVGSWIAMNGIWVELPNLVYETPESWKLASYLTIVCQLANIGPIVYGILLQKSKNKHQLQQQTIYFILILGCIACILLALVWKKTSYIDGSQKSVALITLTFIVALVDCTSSVTFLPFMSILPAIYMSPLYIGETMSGFLPSLVALAQGVITRKTNTTGYNCTDLNDYSSLRFPQSVFFSVLALLMFSSLISFVALNYLPSIKKLHVVPYKSISDETISDVLGSSTNSTNVNTPLIEFKAYVKWYSPRMLFFLLMVLAWLNFIQNGVLSSISSYTSAPYGSVTYHLAATLGSISSAFASFIYLWLPNKSFKVVSLTSALHTILSVYMIWMAVLSPHPLLQYETSGRFIIVTVVILSSAFVSYAKLSIASIMRNEGSNYLLFAGIANQVGSFTGAVIMFPLVNYTRLFSSN